MNDQVGLVAIGRNEGERLQRCLQSVLRQVKHVVYVDSGSTDKSVDFARALGIHVLALDMSRPFTAARARNDKHAKKHACQRPRENPRPRVMHDRHRSNNVREGDHSCSIGCSHRKHWSPSSR